jgi:sortase A
MRKVKSPEDLTIEELRQLLVEKQRRRRREHLERFRRTGRVVTLASDIAPPSLDHLVTTRQELSPEGSEPFTWRERNKGWLDRLLLGVEVFAVLALVFVLFNGLEIIQDLNKQVAEALVQPTLTPTPLISAVVLPSGHTPPNSPGGAKFNEEEIPEHLRPLVQSLMEVAIPTASPEQAVRIQVPAIEVDAPVVQGDGWEQLKKGVAQHIGTANPGQDGNIVLTAHNDVFGEIFRYLDKLKRGDQVIIYTNQRSYTYTITSTQVVEPTQVEVMAPTDNATVTLISCYPYLIDNQRIVVKGVLQTSQ